MKQTVEHDLLMRGIKLLDIGYINVLYVFVALVFAKITDHMMGKFDSAEEIKKNKLRLTLEFIVALWTYGIAIYVARNFVGMIPFPLNGYQGFEHRLVKELGTATAFTFTFVLFSDYIKNKLLFYYNVVLK
jgi:hypothetical protein